MVKLKFIFVLLFMAALVLVSLGCANNTNSTNSADSTNSTNSADSASSESVQPLDAPDAADATDGSEPLHDTESASASSPGQEDEESADEAGTAANYDGMSILIAYFSWADNTTVEEPDSADIDAMTSASVLPPGNAGLIAQWIQESVGGDLFPIIVSEPYSADFNECAARAGAELASGARPELVDGVSNMGDYDIVFLGYPIWNNNCPMAIFSFIEEHDFSGKTVALFGAYGGGSLGLSVRDITNALASSDCTVLEPAFGASRAGFSGAQDGVATWLSGLGVG